MSRLPKMAFENHWEISRIIVIIRTFQNSYFKQKHSYRSTEYIFVFHIFRVDVGGLDVCFDVAQKLIPKYSVF